MQAKVTTVGLEHAVAGINRIGHLRKSTLLTVMAETVKMQTVRRFSTKRDPEGAPWRPLAASTLRGKRRSGDILVNTGHLRNSIGINVHGDVSAEIGTNTFYAKYHHTGSVKVKDRPPKRQFLGVGAQDARELEKVLDNFIRASLG